MLTFDELRTLEAIKKREPLTDRQRELADRMRATLGDGYYESDGYLYTDEDESLALTHLGELVLDSDKEPEFDEDGVPTFVDDLGEAL